MTSPRYTPEDMVVIGDTLSAGLARVMPTEFRAGYLQACRDFPPDRHIQMLGWAVITFGSIAAEPHERALRFVEEAIELAHAAGLSGAEMTAIIGRVWARPPGDIEKEMAQAAMTLGIMSATAGINLRAVENAEFDRVQTIPKEEWQRRHAAKVDLGIALGKGTGNG
jgi:NTP pyrophosphatase (non-canonical NTP hydrolase)